MANRDKTRPAELIGLSAAIGGFIGLITVMVTRDVIFSAVFGGLFFITSLVVLAMIVLTISPSLPKNTGDTTHD